jgi:hypothetical protein
MTEIIFPQVLKLFIKGFSIWFETESEIGENRSYGTQTGLQTKREVGSHWARLDSP